MRSSFFEFTVANSALFVARGGLEVAGHNMANATTRGFSRQVVEQRAARPLALNNGRGMVGSGAEIFGIKQMRDFFLDRKYWANISTLGQFSVKSLQSGLMENTLNEMSGTGLQAQFTRFFELASDNSTSAADNTHRTNLLQHGDFISTQFGSTYETLRRQQQDINQDIRNVVMLINSKATQIASLNQQITRAEFNGSRANDLRDRRAVLIDDLSMYANLDVRMIERNADFAAGLHPEPEERMLSQEHMVIFLDGAVLVDGANSNLLEVRQRRDPNGQAVWRNAEDGPGLYDIFWERTGARFNMYSNTLRGELRGLIDMRDGNNQNHVRITDVAGNVNWAEVMEYDAATGTYAGTGEWRLNFTIPEGQKVDLADRGTFQIIHNGRTFTLYYEDFELGGNPPNQNQVSFSVLIDETTGLPFGIPAGHAGLPPAAAITPADLGALFNTGLSRFETAVTSAHKGIPYYLNRLNTMARTFVWAMNEGQRLFNGTDIPGAIGHRHGHDVNGVNRDIPLFTFANYLGEQVTEGEFNIFRLTAANIRINEMLVANPSLMQGSDDPEGGVDNNEVFLSWSRIREDRSLFVEGSLLDYINSMVSELAIDKRQADQFSTSYAEMSTQVDNHRMAISGVSLDEESVNLIRFQAQFRAAANLVNAIDRIYDTLINRLGAF